ncbi:leucyl aminopeptidase [Methanomassiliicoccales archaeon RumEn M1]|nr:leucyl aminopeptidase [Methanomassiliicoccales archaeon RumEn M1]
MSKLEEAALVAMRDCLGLKAGEEVLIVTNFDNPDSFEISKALFDATKELGGRPVIMVQEAKTTMDNAENVVLKAMEAAPDVIISISSCKMGKDPFGIHVGHVGRDGKRYDHIYHRLMEGDRRTRGFWSPSVTKDTFERTVAVDYEEMKALAKRLKDVLDAGESVRVTAPGGTDVRFSIKGREAKLDDGNIVAPGTGGNLPAGETYICPVNGTTEGVICFDGTVDLITEFPIPKVPVRVVFENGYVTEVTGDETADKLLEVIKMGEAKAREIGNAEMERNARHLGEMGIGINYAAKMVGNMLEDEKVGRTVHFAIGMNYDNDANAFIHQDCLVKEPTVWVDDKQIMKDGVILI